MYKLIKPFVGTEIRNVQRFPDEAVIPFDPANTDYQTFKAQINADEAELQDADGNLMTAEEAKAFVAELP